MLLVIALLLILLLGKHCQEIVLLVIALLLILLLGLHSAGFRVQGLGMFGIIAVLGCLFCACIPTFWGGGSKMWDIELAEPSESLHTWSQAFQQPSKTPNRPIEQDEEKGNSKQTLRAQPKLEQPLNSKLQHPNPQNEAEFRVLRSCSDSQRSCWAMKKSSSTLDPVPLAAAAYTL